MPRILTNKTGLPSPIYYAIKNDTYESRGDISVTSLIDSTYVRILKKYNTYEEDAADMIWSLQGQGVHTIIERVGKAHDNSKFFPEKKLLLNIDGYELSGTTDLLEKKDGMNIVHDFKNTSVWTAMKGIEWNKKWILQTNIYAAMMSELAIRNGKDFRVHELYIHAFLRDWNRNRSEYQAGYPEYASMTFKVPLYSHSSVMKKISELIKVHFEQEQAYKTGGTVYSCSSEDRWERPEVVKMMVPGKKKSLRNFTISGEQSKQDAAIYYAQKIVEYPTLVMQSIKGEDVRCVNYCPVNKFCSYYKNTYGKETDNGGNSASEVSKEGETGLQDVDISF